MKIVMMEMIILRMNVFPVYIHIHIALILYAQNVKWDNVKIVLMVII